MDPKFMMEAMQATMAQGGKDGMDEAGMKHMMEMMEAVQKDPALFKQMEGMWKMMDEMHQNDPEGYKKYVDSNMAEMKEHHQAEKQQERKKAEITSTAYFCFSIRPYKLVTEQPKEWKKEDEIKLFDFVESDLKESFTDNPDKAAPLDTHKLYLNLVSHDSVLPPLRQDK